MRPKYRIEKIQKVQKITSKHSTLYNSLFADVDYTKWDDVKREKKNKLQDDNYIEIGEVKQLFHVKKAVDNIQEVMEKFDIGEEK